MTPTITCAECHGRESWQLYDGTVVECSTCLLSQLADRDEPDMQTAVAA